MRQNIGAVALAKRMGIDLSMLRAEHQMLQGYGSIVKPISFKAFVRENALNHKPTVCSGCREIFPRIGMKSVLNKEHKAKHYCKRCFVSVASKSEEVSITVR